MCTVVRGRKTIMSVCSSVNFVFFLLFLAMADPADRAAFQTLATVKEEPSDLESEAGDIKVKHRSSKG